jgi:hypothetical protein
MSVRPARIADAASLRLLCLLAALSTIVSTLMPVVSRADEHPGDRFAIRAGIWPQKALSGSLGNTQITPGGQVYDLRIEEKRTTSPVIEISGLFHIRRFWWAEGDLGWSTRTRVHVGGVRPNVDSILLVAEGRVDFFPIFLGVRAVRTLGSYQSPHNVYARAGVSIVFAAESPGPSGALDSLRKYLNYEPATKAAFGFAAGIGGEVYYLGNIAAVADVQVRYVRFNYASKAKFDLSGVWFTLGFGYKTR